MGTVSLSQKHYSTIARRFMNDLDERIEWNPEQLKSYRNSALRSLLRRMQAKSVWHAKRLAHMDIERITESDIASIPSMTKEDLMNNFDEIVTHPRLRRSRCLKHLNVESNGGGFLDGQYRVSTSGGTSGNPALCVFSANEASLNAKATFRIISRWMRRGNDFHSLQNIALITTPDPVFSAMQLPRVFGSAKALSITSAIDDLVKNLNRIQPEMLFAYPSLLPRLAYEAMEGRLHISPIVIIVGAEPLLPEHEAAAARAWKSVLINGWGSAEVGVLAVGSGFENGMLLLDDFVIVEPVNRNGDPVATGEMSEKVFVTPLFRYTLPLLRYELTDQLSIDITPAKCGSGFRHTANVHGRLDDVFHYPGGVEIHPRIFRDILGKDSSIHEYQVAQTNEGVNIHLTGSTIHDCERLTRSIVRSLRAKGLHSPVVNIKQVAIIERTGTAKKLKRFIPFTTSTHK